MLLDVSSVPTLLAFGDQKLRALCRIWGSGSSIQDLGFMAEGLAFSILDVGFRV